MLKEQSMGGFTRYHLEPIGWRLAELNEVLAQTPDLTLDIRGTGS